MLGRVGLAALARLAGRLLGLAANTLCLVVCGVAFLLGGARRLAGQAVGLGACVRLDPGRAALGGFDDRADLLCRRACDRAG